MTPGSADTPDRARLLVGNDVVDLSHPRCRDTPLDGRLVRRICAAEERERIARSPEPRRALWRTWAAKEAAYKVVSKRLGAPPPFVHARFVVREDPPSTRHTFDDPRSGRRGDGHASSAGGAGDGEPASSAGPASPRPGGSVWYESTSVRFREEPAPAPDVLHVVAWSPDGPADLEARVEPLPPEPPPLHRLSERERAAVHSPASGWVRLVARRRAAALLSRPESDLQIVCQEGPAGRTAPLLLVAGRHDTSWDVSLSHHGRWVAWALGHAADAPGGGTR